MYKILIAPNSFKGSLTADQAANAIEQGLNQSKLKFQSNKFPIGDGGDHTAFLLTNHLKGDFSHHLVFGAYGDLVDARFGLINRGKTAIIEVAETSGFKTIQGTFRQVLHADTKGLGQLIDHVLSLGVSEIILCLGGSATIDGGLGMLTALGVRFLDAEHHVIDVYPGNFSQVVFIDITGLTEKISHCKFAVLCDVDNPLLGERGAAKVFGPQKGATEKEVILLEAFLSRFNELTMDTLGKSLDQVKFGGAAGGLSAALSVYLNADLLEGAEHFCQITDFKQALSNVDLLITGEGSIDEQTLNGKAPYVAAKHALAANIPVIGLTGNVPIVVPAELQRYFSMLLSIGSKPESLSAAIDHTYENLVRTSKQIGNILSVYNNE
ncbi:glycerate kinase family protein [Pedobacter gandavensis]|uniref:Glycerate kinase n=1 Tax=Pedobacter gandavensis TaxID=2679963 RepID=A0ABR6EQB2_9SPHI|nr:glycerate kinase [Pedobacter gandavensis]MBB2147431.1 glycerate kinase [Pedobacter gandavensis]